MRPLPKRIETFAGRFDVVTDRAFIDKNMSEKNEGECWFNDGQMLLDVFSKRPERHWDLLCHELIHVADEATGMDFSEDQISYLGAFLSHFLRCNGFLDEPHQRGFYEAKGDDE